MAGAFPLRIAAAIIESLKTLLAARKRAEIYFHPGIDPDAEGAVRLIYFWLRKLGCDNVTIYHCGAPSHLSSIEPILPVDELSEGSLFNSEAKEAVTIVVDVSNWKFLTNGDSELLARMREPDFVFDHHHPSRACLKEEAGEVLGGSLVIPEFQCASLLIDRLLLIDIGHAKYLAQRAELAGLVVAAALTDTGLQTIDERPDWFPAHIWTRLDEIRADADPLTIKQHAVEPWKDPAYLAWEKEAVDKELLIRKGPGATAAYCWAGTLPDLGRKLWIGHLADVIQQRREAVLPRVPHQPAFTCVLAAISSPPALYASVRTGDEADAGKVMQIFDDEHGGGRRRASAAMLLKSDFPDAPENLTEWGRQTLTKWGRLTTQVVRATVKP